MALALFYNWEMTIITAFQITSNGNILVKTSAATLDEITDALPQGFYTTFNTVSNGEKALGLHAHLRRLYLPARALGLRPAVEEQTLRERMAQIVKGNLPHESRLRLILTKKSGALYIAAQPFTPLPEIIFTHGIHVITSSLARHDPRIKDTGFISESAAHRKLLNADVFEVLLTKNGKILEGMTSNFYAIKGKALITAKQGILPGVTRRAVLRLARGQGLMIEYRSPRLDENFDEAFLTSSSRGVAPIVSIDNQPVGQGRVGRWTKMLSQAYQVYVQESSERIVE